MVKSRPKRSVRRAGAKACGPSFFPSWDAQRYGELPANFRTLGGEFIVAGLPKSGNVWLTSLISASFDLPVVRSNGKSYVHYTHKGLSPEMLRDPKVFRGVVIVRDLRDVIVSLYHWLKTDDYLSYYKHGPHQIFADIEAMYIEYFLRRFARIDIHGLVDEYVTRGWPVVKYERLWDNAQAEMERLFRIWQIELPTAKVAGAVEQNSIDRLRKTFDPANSATIDNTIRPDHFRVGGYGQYKNEMPAWMIKDIEDRYGDYLRSWGYGVGKE